MPLKKIISPLCAAFCLLAASVVQAEETNTPPTAIQVNMEQGSSNVVASAAPRALRESDQKYIGDVLRQVLIPVAFFGMIVSVVGLGLFASHRKNKMLHETIRAMIDKGQPIPPELLQPEKKQHETPGSALGQGLILSGIGIGLMIFLLLQHNDNWGVGMIPMLIGVALLISWKIESRKKNDKD